MTDRSGYMYSPPGSITPGWPKRRHLVASSLLRELGVLDAALEVQARAVRRYLGTHDELEPMLLRSLDRAGLPNSA